MKIIPLETYPLLKEFLYDAIYLPEGAAAPPREIVNQPELAVYITNFDSRMICAWWQKHVIIYLAQRGQGYY